MKKETVFSTKQWILSTVRLKEALNVRKQILSLISKCPLKIERTTEMETALLYQVQEIKTMRMITPHLFLVSRAGTKD